MTVAQIFNLLLLGGLFTSVLALGCRATGQDVAYLWRRPGLLTRSFLAIFVVMPLVTLVLVLLPLERTTKIALVLLAISPGLPVSPKTMLKIGGNPSYIHSLLFSMTVLSLLTVPAALALLSTVFPEDVTVRPLQLLLKVLAPTFLAPLALGIVLRRWTPTAADRISGPSGIIGQAMLVIWQFGLVILNFRDIVNLGLFSIGAIALWTLVGLVIGHLMPGPDPANRPSLALAVAMRHIGVAALIATTSFAGANPLPMILVYVFAYTLVPVPYFIWWKKRTAAKSPDLQPATTTENR